MPLTKSRFVIEPVGRHDSVIVHIGMALDFLNAGEFNTVCLEHVETGTRHFILDFSATGVLGSKGVEAISSLYTKVAPLNGQVVLASVLPPVEEMLSRAPLDKGVRYFPTLQAAREAFG